MSSSPLIHPGSPAGITPAAGGWVAGTGLAWEAQSLDGRPLDRVWLGTGDVAPLAAEAWRDHCLRRGEFVGLDVLECRVSFAGPIGAASKFVPVLHWRTENQAGQLSLDSTGIADALSRRLEQRCLASGLLQAGQKYLRHWVANEPAPGDAASLIRLEAPFRAIGRAPETLGVRMADLLRWGNPQGATDTAFPVFMSAHVAGRLRQLVRAGEDSGIETGAALVGIVLRGTDEPELGILVTDAFAFEHTRASTTHLELTGASWARLQGILRARRAARPAIPEILVGQAHLHPFLPGHCMACPKNSTCNLDSAWASSEDEAWTRAAFASQPWALCQVSGYSPRREFVERLFSRAGGRLVQRGYHLLPDSVLAAVKPGLGDP